VNLLAGAKTQDNPESTVGILQLAGKVPKMLVTPTPDLGKVLNSMHGMGLEGHVNVATGVQARGGRPTPLLLSTLTLPHSLTRLTRRWPCSR